MDEPRYHIVEVIGRGGMGVALGADPHLTTHRSYGVPRPEPTPELAQMMENTYINPTGELPAPLPVAAAAAALAALDGYQITPTDRRDQELTSNQLKGQFLIDRDGIVRWSHIECGKEGLSGIGKSASPRNCSEQRVSSSTARHVPALSVKAICRPRS